MAIEFLKGVKPGPPADIQRFRAWARCFNSPASDVIFVELNGLGQGSRFFLSDPTSAPKFHQLVPSGSNIFSQLDRTILTLQSPEISPLKVTFDHGIVTKVPSRISGLEAGVQLTLADSALTTRILTDGIFHFLPVEPGEMMVWDGKIVGVTDEAFADAKYLIDPSEPPFRLGDFDLKRGQRFYSWETRRHNPTGRDEAVIQLGSPGPIQFVVIDTKWHDGNHGQAAGLLASKDGVNWTRLVAPVPLEGHSWHVLKLEGDDEWNFVKLEMYPDGGIARLRLYPHVPPQWTHLRPRTLDSDGDVITIRHHEVIPRPT